MKIVLAGRYGVAARALDLLIAGGHEVGAVVTAPSDLERTWQPSVADAAAAAGIPVIVGNINAASGDIRALRPNLILSVQSADLFKPEILSLPPMGCINLHFGRLPEYGGCYPIIWPILNGDSEAGATLHYMDRGFDSGNVIGVTSVAIGPDETGRQLYDRVADAAFDLLSRELPRIAAGTSSASPQQGAGWYYKKDSIDFARDRFVDWHRPAYQVHNRIRAFTFPPFQLPALRTAESVLELWDSSVAPTPRDAAPGTVMGASGGRLMIAVQGGTIGIAHFRRDGRTTLGPDAILSLGLLAVGQQISH